MSGAEHLANPETERSPIDTYFEDAGAHLMQSLALTVLARCIEPQSPTEIDKMITAAQGEAPGYVLPRSTTTDFFRHNLAPNGYVDPVASRLATRNRAVTKYRITQHGIDWGLPSAGATLGWQLRHPDVPLSLLLGKKRKQQARRNENAQTLRLGLYRDLLARPDGAVYDELITETRSARAVHRVVGELENQGVLNITRRPAFRERTFMLNLQGSDRALYLRARPEHTLGTQAMRLAMQRLVDKGATQFTGADLLRAFRDTMPRSKVSDTDIIRAFVINRHDGLLPFVRPEDDFQSGTYRSRISVDPAYLPSIEDITAVHGSLRRSANYRKRARETAFAVIENPEQVATVARIAHDSSALIRRQTPDEWQKRILKHLPLGGIALDALYSLVAADMPRQTTRFAFRQNLLKLKPHVEIDNRPPNKDADTVSVRFAYEPSEHHSDWQAHAACKDMDPDIFLKADRPKPIAQAKTICRDCPVRGDCLGFVLENQYVGAKWGGVWGGISKVEREQLPRIVKDKIKKMMREAEA